MGCFVSSARITPEDAPYTSWSDFEVPKSSEISWRVVLPRNFTLRRLAVLMGQSCKEGRRSCQPREVL